MSSQVKTIIISIIVAVVGIIVGFLILQNFSREKVSSFLENDVTITESPTVINDKKEVTDNSQNVIAEVVEDTCPNTVSEECNCNDNEGNNNEVISEEKFLKDVQGWYEYKDENLGISFKYPYPMYVSAKEENETIPSDLNVKIAGLFNKEGFTVVQFVKGDKLDIPDFLSKGDVFENYQGSGLDFQSYVYGDGSRIASHFSGYYVYKIDGTDVWAIIRTENGFVYEFDDDTCRMQVMGGDPRAGECLPSEIVYTIVPEIYLKQASEIVRSVKPF